MEGIVSKNNLFILGIFLAILSILDTFFTDFGLRNGHIEEANPAMHIIYNTSIHAFYLIKISLPLILLILITKINPKPYFRLLIGSAVLLYFLIVCKHTFWIILVLRMT